MEIIRGKGKLTDPESGKVLAEVSCVINHQPPTKMRMGDWSGSLVIIKKHEKSWDLFNELGDNLNLKLEDGRSGIIIITHWTPIPTDSPAQFTGSGPFK
jgi:hypothetical protein